MHCRVVFSSVKHFSGLLDLFKHVTALTGRPSAVKYDANFFLLGEDIFGTAGEYNPPLPYNELVSFISHLQGSIGPRNFVIFSAYANISGSVLNAVYFIGQKQWYFDFKRVPAAGDLAVCGLDMTKWPSRSRLNPKKHLCAKSGEVCIKGIYLLVCADLSRLHTLHPPKNALIFIPASGMPKVDVGNLYSLKSSGWVFINDPTKGVFLHVRMERPLDKTDFEPIHFEGRESVPFDFDFKP